MTDSDAMIVKHPCVLQKVKLDWSISNKTSPRHESLLAYVRFILEELILIAVVIRFKLKLKLKIKI